MKGDPVEEVLLMRVRWTPEWKMTVLIYSSLCECEQGRGFTTVDDLSVRTEGRKKSRERGQFVFFLQEKDKLSATKTHKLLIRTSQIECQVEQLGFGIKFSQKGEVGASLHWQSGANKERRIINGTLICFFSTRSPWVMGERQRWDVELARRGEKHEQLKPQFSH